MRECPGWRPTWNALEPKRPVAALWEHYCLLPASPGGLALSVASRAEDSDGLWRGQGSGEGAHSELEPGTEGQHREAVAVSGSSQSRVDRRVAWDSEPKGNEV